MKITVDIPAAIEQALEGQDMTQAAKEAMAIAWYQAEKLSIGQVAEFLGTSVYDAEGFMKKHHVDATYSVDDFERDRKNLDRLLDK